MITNLERLDNSHSLIFQTSVQENTVSPRDLEAVDTVTRPVLNVTVHPSRSCATPSPERACATDTSQEDSEMSNAEGQSSDSTDPQQAKGAYGIGARHKTSNHRYNNIQGMRSAIMAR